MPTSMYPGASFDNLGKTTVDINELNGRLFLTYDDAKYEVCRTNGGLALRLVSD